VETGARLDVPSAVGVTAAVAAVKSGQESFAIALIEAGAPWAVRDAAQAGGEAGSSLSALANKAGMLRLLDAIRRRSGSDAGGDTGGRSSLYENAAS
jgi:hypothetical protein